MDFTQSDVTRLINVYARQGYQCSQIVLHVAQDLLGGKNPSVLRAMRGFANEVARRWNEPDAGIWEIRGDGAHHVHSKLMGWLALDRALRGNLEANGLLVPHRTRPCMVARDGSTIRDFLSQDRCSGRNCVDAQNAGDLHDLEDLL